MTDSNYIKVFTGSFIVVQLIADRLNAIGISPVVKDETESGLISVFGATNPGLQQIFVNKDELNEAIEIVESVTSDLEA
ncbi:putative signal transducing protein [Confluentibacter flavum]|uniref:Uncharacterized protein n=1 Tax=Confluentibacter flavum TaxID=1909700 RepID=A0A2N3HNK3_9FLAO|nr:DUF2007 domain-containing protein [Confluentibacter flavum]PKQ46536.1 hypothetical protein CSW08_01875 [Confluentibacter flavum]